MKNIKLLSLMLCILFPLLASAMKIEKDEIDEFTGLRTVITSWEPVCGNSVCFRFRLQNGYKFLDVRLYEYDPMVIHEDDKLLIKSISGEIAQFKSVSIYTSERQMAAIGFLGTECWGVTASYLGDLDYFATNEPRLIRVYTTSSYYDEELNDKDRIKIHKLFEMFTNTLNGTPGVTEYVSCSVTFLKSKDNGRTWDEVRVQHFEDITKDELNTVINDWRNQSSGRTKYDCKIEKE